MNSDECFFDGRSKQGNETRVCHRYSKNKQESGEQHHNSPLPQKFKYYGKEAWGECGVLDVDYNALKNAKTAAFLHPSTR